MFGLGCCCCNKTSTIKVCPLDSCSGLALARPFTVVITTPSGTTLTPGDLSGNCQLFTVSAEGTYTIKVSKSNYYDLTTTLVIKCGDNKTVSPSLLPSNLPAQLCYTVRGCGGYPLAGVSVSGGGTTDATGKVCIDNPSAPTTLTFSKSCYQSKSINISKCERSGTTITLRPDADHYCCNSKVIPNNLRLTDAGGSALISPDGFYHTTPPVRNVYLYDRAIGGIPTIMCDHGPGPGTTRAEDPTPHLQTVSIPVYYQLTCAPYGVPYDWRLICYVPGASGSGWTPTNDDPTYCGPPNKLIHMYLIPDDLDVAGVSGYPYYMYANTPEDATCDNFTLEFSYDPSILTSPGAIYEEVWDLPYSVPNSQIHGGAAPSGVVITGA